MLLRKTLPIRLLPAVLLIPLEIPGAFKHMGSGAPWHKPACFPSALSLKTIGLQLPLVCGYHSSIHFPSFCFLLSPLPFSLSICFIPLHFCTVILEAFLWEAKINSRSRFPGLLEVVSVFLHHFSERVPLSSCKMGLG